MCAPLDPRVSRLLDASGIDPTYQAQMGCRYATPEEVADITGIPQEKVGSFGAIAIPYPSTRALDGSQFHVYRQIDFSPKYLGPPGQSTEIYVPINYQTNKGSFPLVITEGEKKAAFLDSIGIPALGIRGVDMWFDDAARAGEREDGGKLSEQTIPHAVLLREALAADSVLVLVDSDGYLNPLIHFGMDTLRRSLIHHIEIQRELLVGYPGYNPLRTPRNTPVALAICNPRWLNVDIKRNESGSVKEIQAEPVKVGVDDLFLWLLADVNKQSAEYKEQPKVDNHSHDRVKAIHRLKDLLLAFNVSGIGNTNCDLALKIASTCKRQHAYRPKVWMHYEPAKGTWSESTSDEQLAAPPRLAETYSAAAKLLYADIALATGELATVSDEALEAKATVVHSWIAAARATAKSTAASAVALKTTRHQKDILAQTKHKLSIAPESWDQARDSFVCANGVVDLRTRVLTPHCPEHLVTTGSSVVFDVTAESPLWDEFLPKAQTDPAVRRYLQALMGYCMTGRINMEQIYFLKGKGGNGKGTFIETLRFIFGHYAVVVSKSLVLRQHNSEPHPTNLAALRGKHWATVSELPLNGELDSAVIKQLTGGDKQTARKMHQDFSDFDMQATITVDTNDVPRLQEYSPAIRRRVRLIDWKADFEGREDRSLKDSLKLEASGIFNWMLAGVQLYFAGELDNVPEAVKQATAEFWAGMNTVGQWLKELCVIEGGARTDSSVLCHSYELWSRANQIPVIGKKSYLAKLRLQDVPGIQTRESGGKTWVLGVRLKIQAELDMPYVEEDEQPIPRKPTVSETNAYSDSTAAASLTVKPSKFERVS